MVSGNAPGESHGLQVQVPCIVFFVVTPIFVIIRIWTRIKLKNGLGYDDWTILFSFVNSLAVSALMMASCAYGFGQHSANLSVYNRRMTFKLFYVAQAFYKITINLTKASILLLYLRIFIQRPFRIMCYAMLGIILSYMVATFFSSVFQCTPIPRAWDKTIHGTCISIPKNCVMITSIFRMQTLNFSSTSSDPTYDIASSLWTIVEENVGIICACLPSCRPILSMLLPTIFPSNAGSGPYESTSGQPRSNTFKNADSGKNSWTPSRGDKEAMGINLTTVKAHGLKGSTSEESILRRHDELRNDSDGNGIHKSLANTSRSSPVTDIYICADEPNAVSGPPEPGSTISGPMTNHWVMYFVGSTELFCFDPSPSGPGNSLNLIISNKSYAAGIFGAVKVVRLTPSINLTIGQIYDHITDSKFVNYNFRPGGQGCRFWIYSVVASLRLVGYITDSSEANASTGLLDYPRGSCSG
ncbi:hypothetical protein V500_03379 [Pseudogymnoascus sp. VKM F-4518 (FW-2643)]|nr:hypothetical protein V500_03379 [Pseudogymnoascus sp. VKM F-4518 (FW-2643)]